MRAKGRLHKVFCTNLRAARMAAGLTQQQVADHLNVSQPRYAEIESGRFPPGLELMERAAPIVKVKPHQLLDPEFSLELVG